MTRIWRVQVENLDHRNFTAPTFAAVVKKAEAFRVTTARIFKEPGAQITEVRLIAEA